MLEQELHRSVGDDGSAHTTSHEIFNVLCDSGDAEVVFTGALGKREEEVRGVFVFHELPGFVDDEDTLTLVGFGLVPDVVQYYIHGDGTELVLEVTKIEYYERVVNVYVALLAKDAGECSSRVFAQALRQLGAGATHVQQCVIQIGDCGWLAGVCQRVIRDAGLGVGFDERRVEVGLLGWRECWHQCVVAAHHLGLGAAHHESEQAVERDEVRAERVIGFL